MSEYAPEYTKKERLIICIKHIAWALPLVLITQHWFFPWLSTYSDSAHCYRYGALTGLHVIFYSLFVGIPLLLVFALFLLEGLRNLQVIRVGQNPLPHEKVFKVKKYQYGIKAKIKPYLFFAILLGLVLFSVYGFFSARDILSSAEYDTSTCTVSD